MTRLKTILMSGAAAVALAATPALSQATLEPQADPAAGQQTTQAAPGVRSYDDAYGDRFPEWGNLTAGELLGTQVYTDAGEAIGEIDNFGLTGDELVAIVGVGGFLGIGEHNVAVPVEQLQIAGDQLVMSGVTREQLEAMPEFDAAETSTIGTDQTLRAGYEEGPAVVPGLATDTAMTGAPAAEEEAAEEVAEMAEAADEAADKLAPAGEEVADAPAEPLMEETEADVAEAPAADAPMATQPPAVTAEAPPAADAPLATEAPAVTAEAPEADAPLATETAQAPQADAPLATETEMAETDDTGWTEQMDVIFADIADREIAELIGMSVAGADGEIVGEVDNFALEGQDVVAIVGVGGFLGIGEHDVALSLGDMTFDGEKLVLSAITEDQLREMPAYEGDEANRLPADGTLRSSYAE